MKHFKHTADNSTFPWNRKISVIVFTFCLSFFSTNNVCGVTVVPGGKVYSITIANPSYKFDHASYSLFIPDSVTTIQGIFIHQHGCTMEGTGQPAAYDIQYQAFAKKWNLAIIGPDLYPKSDGGCQQWIDPENGSGSALFAAIDSFSQLAGHSEIKIAPWLLWGHSGGGYWVLAMLKAYPERILAVASYSAAFDPNWDFPAQAAKVPVLLRHAGSGDINSDEVKCWLTSAHIFTTLRNMDGCVTIAHNLNQTHNFSYIRYMAIPFYEAVLNQRLPKQGSKIMRDMNPLQAWLGDTITNKTYKSSTYVGDRQKLCWLPDSITAVKWSEYVTTGTVSDKTPPPSPHSVKIFDGKIIWEAEADIESGIKCFNIYKNSKLIGQLNYQSFDTNGDNCSSVILPKMEYRLDLTPVASIDTYAISAINHFNLESLPATITCDNSKRTQQLSKK